MKHGRYFRDLAGVIGHYQRRFPQPEANAWLDLACKTCLTSRVSDELRGQSVSLFLAKAADCLDVNGHQPLVILLHSALPRPWE